MLMERYRLTPAAAARVRAEAEIAEAGAQDTVQFTRLIKQAVPYEERTGVVEALWRVAAADGINADERGLMRLVSEPPRRVGRRQRAGAPAGARRRAVAPPRRPRPAARRASGAISARATRPEAPSAETRRASLGPTNQ